MEDLKLEDISVRHSLSLFFFPFPSCFPTLFCFVLYCICLDCSCLPQRRTGCGGSDVSECVLRLPSGGLVEVKVGVDEGGRSVSQLNSHQDHLSSSSSSSSSPLPPPLLSSSPLQTALPPPPPLPALTLAPAKVTL
jgi:hypothetical protein